MRYTSPIYELNKTLKKDTGAIILSAGVSKRMNTSKPFLQFDTTQSFLKKIIDEYAAFGCGEIIVVLNSNIAKIVNRKSEIVNQNVIFVVNKHLEHERFYSIKLGIQKLRISEFCFIQNVDNPFINSNILNSIYEHKIVDGYVSPSFEGSGGHPILLGKDIIGYIKSLKANNANFRDVLKPYPYNKVELNDDKVLININTVEEYRKYFNDN